MLGALNGLRSHVEGCTVSNELRLGARTRVVEHGHVDRHAIVVVCEAKVADRARQDSKPYYRTKDVDSSAVITTKRGAKKILYSTLIEKAKALHILQIETNIDFVKVLAIRKTDCLAIVHKRVSRATVLENLVSAVVRSERGPEATEMSVDVE